MCNPIGGSPPGSTVSGILQARTLEGVATAFSDQLALGSNNFVAIFQHSLYADKRSQLSLYVQYLRWIIYN